VMLRPLVVVLWVTLEQASRAGNALHQHNGIRKNIPSHCDAITVCVTLIVCATCEPLTTLSSSWWHQDSSKLP